MSKRYFLRVTNISKTSFVCNEHVVCTLQKKETVYKVFLSYERLLIQRQIGNQRNNKQKAAEQTIWSTWGGYKKLYQYIEHFIK